jgi:uncharacterized protein (DUF1697 family)
MHTYISILRGINVSGQKMIKMDALRILYENLNFANVQTYIQSGNVIFQDRGTDTSILEGKIAGMIREKFSYDVPVMVIRLVDFETVYLNNPFLIIGGKDIGFLHVTFLGQVPDQTGIANLNGDFGRDEFAIQDKVVYLYCPDGYGRTKLSNSFFESRLKVTATTRNWKTVAQLTQMARLIR